MRDSSKRKESEGAGTDTIHPKFRDAAETCTKKLKDTGKEVDNISSVVSWKPDQDCFQKQLHSGFGDQARGSVFNTKITLFFILILNQLTSHLLGNSNSILEVNENCYHRRRRGRERRKGDLVAVCNQSPFCMPSGTSIPLKKRFFNQSVLMQI